MRSVCLKKKFLRNCGASEILLKKAIDQYPYQVAVRSICYVYSDYMSRRVGESDNADRVQGHHTIRYVIRA